MKKKSKEIYTQERNHICKLKQNEKNINESESIPKRPNHIFPKNLNFEQGWPLTVTLLGGKKMKEMNAYTHVCRQVETKSEMQIRVAVNGHPY